MPPSSTLDSPVRPKRLSRLRPSDRIAQLGHRTYVGGKTPEMWYSIGRLQYHFLVSQGLRPDHRFLDVGCGALRLGQFLIPYLNRGHYFGLEAEPSLVAAGLRDELPDALVARKAPVFGYGYAFDVGFVPGFDVAMAQSLFTHLTPDDIGVCLQNLRAVTAPQAQLYFSFFEGDRANRKGPSNARRSWFYTADRLTQVAAAAGWATDYIGDWGHPRGQKMMRATPLPKA